MLLRLFGPILLPKLDRLGTYAAALAYCFVLSLIPFLVVTFTLGSQLAPKDIDLGSAYKDLLSDILPPETVVDTPLQKEAKTKPGSVAAPEETQHQKAAKVAKAANLSSQIITTLQSSSHHGLATVGFILAVYTSFNLMEQIVRTLLFIFDDPRRPAEWNWSVVLKTIALLIIWMFLLLLISIVSVITPVFHKILEQLQLNAALLKPLLIVRDLLLLAGLFGAFFLTYYLVPTKRPRLNQVRNGALVASCGWIFVSLIFAYVLPNMWRANAVYEALGSVVVILLWAQACAWSVIIGACWIVRFSPRTKKG